MSAWRNAVRVELARYRKQTGQSRLTLDDLRAFSLPHLRTKFPNNSHPDAKLRQQLQQLRDRDELAFVGDDGTYRIRSLDLADTDATDFDRIAAATPDDPPTDEKASLTQRLGDDAPRRARRVTDELVRDRQLAAALKDLYDHTCQLCGARRRKHPDCGYAEAHHIEPLGDPHCGPDIAANLLVACPNHHADLDHGLVKIDPGTLSLTHAYEPELTGRTLTVADDHDIGTEYLRYQNETIAAF